MLRSHEDRRPRLLLVDDEPTNLHVLRQILGDDYRLQFATDGAKAIQLAQQQRPDLILLDIMMPNMNGYEVCRRLKEDVATQGAPVIFVTAMSEMEDEEQGFAAGGVDYILKPVRASIVKARVKSHLSLVRADVLHASRLQIVQRLGRAAEYKDNETGMHVLRMSHYSQALALAIGCSPEWADDLLHAAPMHDVGKIGIPDAVLLKPGPLDDGEWTVMRQHPAIGAEIIGEHDSGILQLARSIALTHHEKWDGSGYPLGLQGEAIPLAARIVAIADVLDALTSVRPYKKAWSMDEAFAHIAAQAGTHFDPALVPVFVSLRPQIEAISQRWRDDVPVPEMADSL
ncbi:MAG: two-component system response regulator [Comamonas sp.]|nr:two-component system response regulator [Candidatus Comamonas equi]